MKAILGLALFGTIATSFLAPTAQAALQPRDDLIHAQGACQPSIPTSSLRSYVTGLRNVGTTDIYVTCATPGIYYNSPDGGSTFIRVAVGNVNGSARPITCTLYTGWASNTTAGSVSQGTYPAPTVSVGPSTVTFIDWSASTTLPADSYFSNASFTCKLAPYTEIKWIRRAYNEEVGT